MEAGLVIFVSWTQSFEVAVFSDYAFQALENTVDGLPLTHEPPYRPRSRSWTAVSFWVTRSLESRRCALQDVAWPSRDLGAEDRCIRASSSGLNRLSCMFRLGLWLLSAGVAVIKTSFSLVLAAAEVGDFLIRQYPPSGSACTLR